MKTQSQANKELLAQGLKKCSKCKEINDRFENRVEFFRINVDTRETIIRFIFNEERKARKQGKG